MNPSFINFKKGAGGDIILIQFLASTVIFPMISIFMMKGLDLIDSIEMKDKKERVGPLLITSLFYVWSFLNFKKYGFVPSYLTFFVLGGTVSLFLSFFITLFDKISLHTVAFSALITGIYITSLKFSFYEFPLNIGFSKLLVSVEVLIMFLIVILGLIATARLYLRDHNNKQVYLGIVVGFFSMVSAAIYYF